MACEHGAETSPFTVTVLGHVVSIDFSDGCAACLEEYLNELSTICAACQEPILPTQPVGQAPNGSEHRYTHMFQQCCASGALYCGLWGEGELVTLHELEPNVFPPQTATVAAYVMKTGKTVHVTVVEE